MRQCRLFWWENHRRRSLTNRISTSDSTLAILRFSSRLEDANKGLLDSRELLERQNQQLADFESEVGLLRRRMELLETDREKDKKLINTLQETLNRTRAVSFLNFETSLIIRLVYLILMI